MGSGKKTEKKTVELKWAAEEEERRGGLAAGKKERPKPGGFSVSSFKNRCREKRNRGNKR